MIAEAVDTAVTLGWALCAWIVLMAAVASLAVWTVLVTVWCAVRATVRGVLAVRSLLCARVTAEEAADALRLPRAPRKPSGARTAAHVPSWADTDKEAA